MPAAARAQQAPRELHVDAPPACADESALRARITAHLAGADPSSMPVIDAQLTIIEVEESYRAELVLREEGVEARRALADRRCDVVLDAAALVIAFALVPGLALGEPEPAPVEPPVVDAPTDPPTTDARARVSGALRLAAHGSIGVLPGIVVGGELAGAIVIDWFRLELGVRGTPFAGARFAASATLGGDLGMATALVRGCGMAAPDPALELGACVGLEAGAAFGHGVGLSRPTDAAAPWVAIEGGLRATWVPLPFLAFLLEIQALVPVVRPVFSVAGLGVLYRPEPVSGALQLGVELRFR